MKKNLTIALTIIASNIFYSAQAIPCLSQQSFGDQQIKDLAKDGHLMLQGKKYSLIGQTKTKNDYRGKLLGNQNKLNKFLQDNNITHAPKNTAGHTIRVTSLTVQNQRYCAYNISVGTENAVIAIKPQRPGAVNLSQQEVQAALSAGNRK